MKKLSTLMVAPNGARKTKDDHPALPITLDEIVSTAIECHATGADGLHLHVRDEKGRHTLDAGRYRETLAALRSAVPDMALQITTEAVGQYSPAEQRKTVWDVEPEAVSISLAEMFADGDDTAAIGFYRECAEADIAVQHILYGESDLQLMQKLFAEKQLALDQLQLLFVLGRYTENQQSIPADLDPFISWQRANCSDADWAVCAFGKQETNCLIAAYQAGGKARVGFENSFWNADGTVAQSNSERCAEIVNVSQGCP